MKRLIQLLSLVVGILCSAHTAHAQYPSFQQTLLNERVGFGRNATGGAGGEVYWVTSLADDQTYGTLRWGLEQDDNPRWIMFAVNGAINLGGSPIQVRSNKTVDGRGASITLNNHGMWIGRYDNNGVLQGSRNVIVENITIANGANANLNGIMIQEGATDVWVDHCTFTNLPKIALDVWSSRASVSDVTISWCRFNSLVYGVLIGHEPGTPNAQNIHVTLHHNFFNRVDQRSPFIRKALVHAFNNYLFDWQIFGMGSFDSAQLRNENNIFHAQRDQKGVIVSWHSEPTPPGFARNLNNWNYNNSATFQANNPGGVFEPTWYYSYSQFLEPAINNSGLLSRLQTESGATRSSGYLANMSTRAHVQSGQGALISGFHISGSPSDTKRVIIRALGPSLSPWFPNAMGNPKLTVYNVYGHTIHSNDNWGDSQGAEIQATGVAPSHYLEAAAVLTLPAGAYTAAIDGWGTGIAVLEIYDLQGSAPAKLVNISSRATVDPSNPPIAGFIASSGWTKLIIRGIGPSLANFNIQNPISDPTLTLYDANGTQIAYNNNWQDTQASGISQMGFAPSDWREAAIVTNLAPGSYTAILRDYFNNWGIGSVELYKF